MCCLSLPPKNGEVFNILDKNKDKLTKLQTPLHNPCKRLGTLPQATRHTNPRIAHTI